MEVDALSVSLRALSFLALFQAAGVAMFLALFGHSLTTCEPVVRRLGIRSALVAIVLVLAHYLLEAARMTGDMAGAMDGTYQSMVMHSTLSVALACRIVGLALILTALCTRSAASKVLGVVGGVLAVLGFTFVGHTTTHTPRWLLSVLLLVHVLAVAFWFGALLPLFRISALEPARIAGKILADFSLRATWLVPGLFVAGLFLAVGILPNVAALSTTYGELLLFKVGGFAVLMLLATLNKWTYAPALERGEAGAGRAFRRTVLAEYAIVAVILCATAALTTFYSPDG